MPTPRVMSGSGSMRAGVGSGLDSRVGSRLREHRGDTLIEVVISAFLLLVIAGGVVSGLTVFSHESAGQRHHGEADALAQQAEGQLRGMQLSALQSLIAAGGSSSTVTVNGTIYQITNTASYVSATSSGQSCTGTGSGSADYIKTTSTVQWGVPNAGTYPNDGGKPVVEEGVLTASSGSSLVVQVLDENAQPDPGITISVSGTDANTSSTNTSQNTDSNGCAIFYGLTAGTYSVSAAGPTGAGYIDPTGNANPTTSPPVTTLIAGQTTNVSFEMAVGGKLTGSFQAITAGGVKTPVSSYGGGSTAWVLQNSSLTPSSANETASTVTPLFPFTNQYTAFAGPCTTDNLAPSVVSVPAGQSPGASTQLLLPYLVIAVATNGTTSNTSSTLTGIRFFDTGCTPSHSYPTAALNAPNLSGATSTSAQSEALPPGTYSACAQWAVASTATTSSPSTTSTQSTYTTTSTRAFPRSTTTITTSSLKPSTTTVTYTTTSTVSSDQTVTSVTNNTSQSTTATVSQAGASGTC